MEPTIYKPSIYKGAGIYKAGDEGGGGGDLPEGYKRALSCKSRGGIYLEYNDLDVDINDTYKIKFRISLNAPNATTMVFFGARTSNKEINTYGSYYSGSGILAGYTYYGNSQITGTFIQYPTEYIIEATAKKRLCTYKSFNYNNTINRGGDYENEKITKLNIFSNTNNDNLFVGEIDEFIIYDKDDANKVNAEFIPAFDENNILGFYEKISGQFKGNANLIE